MQNIHPGSATVSPSTGALTMSGQQVALRGLYALNPSGPFYRFVLTYLVASAGLTPVYDSIHYADFLKGVAGRFSGTACATAEVDLSDCVTLARGNTLPQRDAEISMCCMLANTAFESLTDANKKKPEPVIQFFRHVRNAASHGNMWNFLDTNKRKEPRLPAAWRGIRLDHTMPGKQNPLQGKPCFYGTIGPADLLYLLQDVELLL